MARKVLLIIVCMLVSDWANVLLKLGATRDSFVVSASKILGIFSNPYLLGGFFLYGLGMMLWLTVLSQNKFSTVIVFFSIHYIHLMLLSRFVFKEPISWNMWAGAVLIVLGVGLFSATNLLAAQP
jgi:drug/metabolite transporter (DMT)-like permease